MNAVLVASSLVACDSAVLAPVDREPTPTSRPTADTGSEVPPRRWVTVTTHPCAMDSDGFVVCWNADEWDEGTLEPPSDVAFDSIYAPHPGNPYGITREGVTLRWNCANPGNNICEIPDLLLGSTLGGASAVFPDGRLHTWASDTHVGDLAPIVRFHQVDSVIASVDESGLFAGTYWGGRAFGVEIDPTSVAEVVGFFRGGCALHHDGTIECHGRASQYALEPPRFRNGSYVDISGGEHTVCATREDWSIVCNDGSTFDFGPYRDMAALDIGPNIDVSSAHLHICVITEDNAIRCEGPRYLPSLQAQLPSGE